MRQLSFAEQIEFSVARLETERSDGMRFFSTGFFYEIESVSDPSKHFVFIITNRHALEGMNKVIFYLSQGAGNDQYPSYGPPLKHEMPINTMTVIYHPDEEIDLCAIPITIFIKARSELNTPVFYRTFVERMIPSDADVESFDALEDILMVGYPNGLWDERHNLPVFRKGITATPIAIDYNDAKEFLIDAACFKGSSGSPVLICDIGHVKNKYGGMTIGDSRVFLLGVLYSAPHATLEGEIVMDNRPGFQTDAKAKTRTPINIGRVLNYKTLRELTAEIRNRLNIN